MSTKKDCWFKVIAGILPFLLLLFLEASLRIAGFGNNLSLFIEDPKHPGFLRMNNKVSLRYFLQEKNATKGNIELFPKKKKNGTVRIFVQGESTAVGFPYFHNGAFPRMLAYRLQHSFPETEWELINLSMTALNSYALYDFTDEIIRQRPDAVIINAGHNEYYGALGVGSTGKIGNSVAAGRMGIALRKTKTGQLLSKFISSFSQDANKTDYDQTLMKRMVKSQEIPFDSKMYRAGITQFEKNLKGTLEKYHRAGIKVFLTNTVSNLKDLPPFISLDSCNAMSWYQQGEAMFSQKEYVAAKQAYMIAKEFDALRFRAPEAINEIIRDLSGRYDNVVFVDVENAFEEQSPGGIIGESLMLEHLHPNLHGHFIIADVLFEYLKRDKFSETAREDAATFENAWQELPMTEVDSLTGVYANWLLREGWPFNETIPADDGHEKSLEEAIAGGLAVRTIKWEPAMLQLLQHYITTRQLDKAVKTAEGFILEYPYEHAFYDQLINLCIDAKQYPKGIYYARKAYSLKKTPETARQLVILHLKSDEPEQALPYLDVLIASGGNVNFRPMKDIAQKIIAAKKQLLPDGNNKEVRKEIYQYYRAIQNMEAASKYKE